MIATRVALNRHPPDRASKGIFDMQPLPHHYSVSAHSKTEGSVELTAHALPTIESAAPAEYGGPGDKWSPESLLMAAVADCFALTFRAIARASKLDWTSLECHAEGTLDRVERVTRFVAIRIVAELTLAPGANPDSGRRLLEKAEKTCLVTNTLDLTVDLETNVSTSA